jgi:hypothetical protein
MSRLLMVLSVALCVQLEVQGRQLHSMDGPLMAIHHHLSCTHHVLFIHSS